MAPPFARSSAFFRIAATPPNPPAIERVSALASSMRLSLRVGYASAFEKWMFVGLRGVGCI
eukprot:3754450-Rhodomonas_salina.4